MKKISSRILKTDQELKAFHEKALVHVGVDFPLSYLTQGPIRIFYLNGKLVGGYALIRNAPFRTIASIPNEHAPHHLNEKDIFEVTALWLDREVRNGLLSSYFWLNFSRDIFFQTDKKYFIYAYDLQKVKLRELYKLANPKILYQGEVKQLAGNKSTAFESIEIASRIRLGFLLFYGFQNFMMKIFFCRKTYFKDLKILKTET